MGQTYIDKAVGNGGINQKNDVLKVVKLLKQVSPDCGGFQGLPPQPALSDAEQGVCRGNQDDFLVQVISRFQGRYDALKNEAPSKGRLDPWGMTIRKMIEVSNTATPVAGNPGYIVVPPQQPNMAFPGDTGSGTLDGPLRSILQRQTKWRLGGSSGVSGGLGEFSAQAGGFTVIRPDGSNLDLVMAAAGVGVSLAPGSLSVSLPNMPGAGIDYVYMGQLATGGDVADSDFIGSVLVLTGSATTLIGAGAGISMYFFGMLSAMRIDSAKDLLLPIGGVLLECFTKSRAIGLAWGTQAGTPDAGGSIMVGVAVRQKDIPTPPKDTGPRCKL